MPAARDELDVLIGRLAVGELHAAQRRAITLTTWWRSFCAVDRRALSVHPGSAGAVPRDARSHLLAFPAETPDRHPLSSTPSLLSARNTNPATHPDSGSINLPRLADLHVHRRSVPIAQIRRHAHRRRKLAASSASPSFPRRSWASPRCRNTFRHRGRDALRDSRC